jgi:transposase
LAQAARGNGLGGTQEEAGHEAPGGRDRVEERRALWRQLEENREATSEEHRRLWERERGVRVSVATMSRVIRRLGWTYKQRRWEPPSATKRQGALGEAG